MRITNASRLSTHLLGAGLCAMMVAGCSAHAGVGTHMHTKTYAYAEGPDIVFVEPPTLVAIDRDVWVVEECDHEVFWVGGFYWVHYGDIWYRSSSYSGGWVRVETHVVPTTIVRIRPGTYVAYHRPAGAVVRRAEARPVARPAVPPGHRNPPGMRRGHRPNGAPAYTDKKRGPGRDRPHGKKKHHKD